MATLESRLAALVASIGADIKSLVNGKVTEGGVDFLSYYTAARGAAPANTPLSPAFLGVMPPPGGLMPPSNFRAATSTALKASNIFAYYYDFSIATSLQSLVINSTVANSGGAWTWLFNLYPDDGTGGQPNLSVSPIWSGSIAESAIATNGQKVITCPAVIPRAGRYWLTSLILQTTAPTTWPTVSSVADTSPSFWWRGDIAARYGINGRALWLSGVNSQPTAPIVWDTTPNTDAPLIALRRAS